MTRIHYKCVNNIAECNLLHDVLNPSKRIKYINSHYYHIIHRCINTRMGREKYKYFQILLDSGFSSTIVMISIETKLKTKNIM